MSKKLHTSKVASQQTIVSNDLRVLRHSLGLPVRSSKHTDDIDDVLLVSIDIENASGIRSMESAQAFQIGIAIFDTKKFLRILSCPNIETAITTYNFAVGSPSYCASAAKKFLFGRSITVSQQDVIRTLNSVIPRARNIVFGGHDFQNDLRALQRLGFDTQTSVLGYLDTMKIARDVIPNTPINLRDVLTKLGCPFDKLHSAGNDANFTLRALLLLSVHCYIHETLRWENPLTEEDQRTVRLIREIAYSTLPLKLNAHEKALRKKQKRFEKSRKHQSKLWDLDTQELIRAERAARRALQDNGTTYSIPEMNEHY